jgi:hypothetical protein
MAITETDRRRLHRALHAQIGEEEADILMKALPHDPDRLATSDDLRVLGADLRSEMADLRTEMADLRTDLRTEMTQLSADLRAEMAELGTGLRAELHEATTGQTPTLLFGLIGTVVSMSTVQLASLIALS